MSTATRENVQAVIFDLDGTLVDSEDIGLAVLERHAVALGAPFAAGEGMRHMRGMPMRECLAYIARQAGRPLPEGFEAWVRADMARVFRSELLPMPGARDMLQGLRVPYCIATNGHRAKASLTLELTGLLPLFEERLFCAYDVGYFKPDPRLFLHAAEALAVAANRCAVVEDSVPGMRAGIAAGMLVYAMTDAAALPDDVLPFVRPIRSLAELLAEPWNRAAD